jgi:Uma2 family endonuclease
VSTLARITVAEYDRMAECGVFDRDVRRRLELIQGEIREMNPIGPLHENAVDALAEWSLLSVPRQQVRVRVQNSLGLPGLESVPEPDLAWVARRDYSQARPTAADVFLVIEVAESSLRYDLGEKADLYAAAGMVDYWVVNLPDRTIQVRRDPAEGRYRSLRAYAGEEVRPLAFPEIALSVSLLWPS